MSDSVAAHKLPIVWAVVAVLFILVAAVAGYKIWPLLNPPVAQVARFDPDCDLRAGPCSVGFADGGVVQFAIEPKDIPVVKPLQFAVELQDIEATSVAVDFQGVDMNMGYNRATLNKAGEQRYTGQGMLPVCVRYAMEWEARVLVDTPKGLLAAPFRFITVTPGMEPPSS
jgi:hypothetical protein